MTSYLDRLGARTSATGSVLCVGVDPDPAALPAGFPATVAGVERFARLIVEAALPYAAAVKPNLAFFEARLLPTAPGGGAPLLRPVLSSPALLTGLMAGAEYAIEVTAVDSAGRVSPPSTPPAIAVAGSP